MAITISPNALDLDILSYDNFINNVPETIGKLKTALYQKGIVGIKGIPEYAEKVRAFIEAARTFSSLPEEQKIRYAPDHEKGEMFLGYEAGKERFKNSKGQWVIDDLKTSFYGLVPDCRENKWPEQIDLRTPFEDLGALMSSMGKAVMRKIELIGPATGIELDGIPSVGRMLYYRSNKDVSLENPFWCGSHFDHGLFTALIPASYFMDGVQTSEPDEAGLFVKTTLEGKFQKVVSDDPEIMLFQVGEFGQLATNDAIKATEHQVHKSASLVERITMALFFDAPMDTSIRSKSVLTADDRYGTECSCTYSDWHNRSFQRYIVKESD